MPWCLTAIHESSIRTFLHRSSFVKFEWICCSALCVISLLTSLWSDCVNYNPSFFTIFYLNSWPVWAVDFTPPIQRRRQRAEAGSRGPVYAHIIGSLGARLHGQAYYLSLCILCWNGRIWHEIKQPRSELIFPDVDDSARPSDQQSIRDVLRLALTFGAKAVFRRWPVYWQTTDVPCCTVG